MKSISSISSVFLYNEKFGEFSYGSSHPMRPMRLRLTYELIKELGLHKKENSPIIESRKSTKYENELAHTSDYIETLMQADSGEVPSNGSDHGLGYGDNPVFKGVYEWSSYSAGASIEGAQKILDGECTRAFNICGGLHHAMRNRASGFCYINDPVVAIEHLTSKGKRVAYIDIDAHHGDGVEAFYYDRSDVLTISLHESGRYLFPGTGFAKDFGKGEGAGYAVNLPMPPYAGDELFVEGFNRVVPDFIKAFKPDVIVTQLGVDTFASDPITHLNLTTRGFQSMLESFAQMNIPWLALGGGGYDIDNVKRAWTLAWAVISGQDVDETLHDKEHTLKTPTSAEIEEVENDINYLFERVLPLIKV